MPQSDYKILADATQIHQVLINLCTNATHFMKEDGGVLEVVLRRHVSGEGAKNDSNDLPPGDYVELSVTDTGPGIDPDDLDKIFDPYFTTKEVGKGTGMGLAVVHGIVKNNQGVIFVDSELGIGSVFSIFFPILSEQSELTASISPELSNQYGDETILFVDDEEYLTDIAEKGLGDFGYNVQTYTNPVKALLAFEASPNHFDLIITDMTMPQMSGVQFSKKIKEIKQDIPIIICSGHSSVADEKKMRDVGISTYAMKPIGISEIAKLIRKVMDS